MVRLHEYIAWCERKIALLVVAEGLHLGLLGVIQGPLTLTFKIQLLQPSPKQLQKLIGLVAALKQVLHVRQIRITQESGYVAIEIPSPIYRTPNAHELATHTRGLNVCVGYNTLRQPVYVDLQQHGALFWVGPSRRGKTQSMKSTLYALAQQNRVKFAILCQERKKEDWQAFESVRGCLGIATSPDEHTQVLTWATDYLLQRQSPFKFIIVCDDLLNLLNHADLGSHLADIASTGAGLGVHLLIGTQEAGSRRGTGGIGVENNATARILYRTSNATAAARATGQGSEDLQALSGVKGDALLLLDGEPVRIATGWIHDEDINNLPQGVLWQSPWFENNTVQHDTTPHNNSQHDVADSHDNDNVVPNSGGNNTAVATVEGVAVPPELALLVSKLFPIKRRPPTKDEAAAIIQLKQYLSWKKLSFAVYHHKDGKTDAWVKAAIQGAIGIVDTPLLIDGKPNIDMNTPEGEATVKLLISQGLLPHDDITILVKAESKV